MGKMIQTAGLFFLAAASVYSSQAIVAAVEGRVSTPASIAAKPLIQVAQVAKPAIHEANPAPEPNAAPDSRTNVKVLDDSTDPFATALPTTAPSADATASSAASTQPSEGRSVSSSEVSVTDAGTVEIHVNDANLVEVLRMLSLQSQKNIIASKDVHGTITANLYDVTVREALDAILHANGYAYREKGNFIYVYTVKELADIEKSERHMETQVFHVYYTPAANAMVLIKPVLSAGAQVAVTTPSKEGITSTPGGGEGNNHAGDEMIVITDYPENIEAARKVLAEVDKRPQQILLEATILRATLNEDNALGVDFNVLGGVDLNSLVVGAATGQITGAGVVAQTNGAASTGGSTDSSGSTSGTSGGSGNTVPVSGRTSSVGTGNSFTSSVPSGLKVGYVTSSVSVLVAALEQVTDTTILANPKILALNRQQGEVFVGNEDGYYTTVTTETTTSQTVNDLKTGTRLIFRPYIADDGYIRLEVHPEDSDGQVNANGLPSKTTTETTSSVMVKDGHTIVIGGLFRETTSSARSQVPFLGNLPLAGVLFRNQADHTVREEVIILLTPHIIKDDNAYSKLSEGELKHANDLRAGLRRGLMPWGRQRMAEGWYEAARKEMAKPNPDRDHALWCLDCATNLNPLFTEAIEMKERISGHEVTVADGFSIKSFVQRAIMKDIAPTTQPATQAVDITTMNDATTRPSLSSATTRPVGGLTALVPATQPSEAIDQTADTTVETGADATGSITTPLTQDSPGEKDLSQAMVGTAEASTDEDATPLPSLPEKPAPATPIVPVASPTEEVTVEPPVNEIPTTQPQPEAQTTTVVTPLGDSTTSDVSKGEESKSESAAPATQPVAVPATEPSVVSPNVTVVPLDDAPADQSN